MFLATSDNFNITSIDPGIAIQTTTVATISEYSITQQSQEVSAVGFIDLTFKLVNPLSKNGKLLLTWSDQSQVLSNTTCQVDTAKMYGSEVCKFDFTARTLTIQGAFEDKFEGTVTVAFSDWRNAASNKEPTQLTFQTFDGDFAVDSLSFN